MNATKFVSTPTARGRVTHLEVEFTGRDGQTHLVTGPVAAATLTTGTKPRPKGALHVQAVLQALQVCEAAGMEFWAVAEEPRTHWAIQDGQFFMVHHVIQRAIITVTPVDAWGTPTGATTELPAPAGL